MLYRLAASLLNLFFLRFLPLCIAESDLRQAIGTSNTLPCNFTLAALNMTLPNANSTGAPLVLGWGGT